MKTVLQHLEDYFDESNECQLTPRIVCNDGFNISVQGGNRFNYCDPRERIKLFWLVELGFPSEPIPELKEYKDGKEYEDMETVFGYVPIEKVEALIQRHGGINEAKSIGKKEGVK